MRMWGYRVALCSRCENLTLRNRAAAYGGASLAGLCLFNRVNCRLKIASMSASRPAILCL